MPDPAAAQPAANANAQPAQGAQAPANAAAAQPGAAAAQPAQGAPAGQQAPAQGQQPAVPAALAAILATGQQGAPAGQQAPAQGQAPAAGQQGAAEPARPTADEQIAALQRQVNAGRIREHVFGVATEAGAHSAEQVLKLIADELDVSADGLRVIVRGDPRADARQHVARYLASNLHLLKPVVQGGGAGAPGRVDAPAGVVERRPANTVEGGTQRVNGAIAALFPQPPQASTTR